MKFRRDEFAVAHAFLLVDGLFCLVDVEHEESFSRGKGTPGVGVVLPGGPRAMSAQKGAGIYSLSAESL